MNWKLILLLSLFGLAMGIGTVFAIPSNIEPFCWLAIFLVSAFLIAKQVRGKHFLHGLAVGVVNSFWVTSAHVLLFARYAEDHLEEFQMMGSLPLHEHPRLLMAIVGPVIGVVSGAVIGLFAVVAGKFVKPAD